MSKFMKDKLNGIVFIYALVDPRDNSIKYIGKTINMKERLRQHIGGWSRDNPRKDRWIKKLKELDLEPKIIDIHKTDELTWPFWEIFYIDFLKKIGLDLFNILDGGDSPPSRKGSHLSNWHLERIREASTGKKFSKKSKEKISKALLGNTNGKFKKASDSERWASAIRESKVSEEKIIQVYEMLKCNMYLQEDIYKITGVPRHTIYNIKYKIGLMVNKVLNDYEGIKNV